MKSLKLSVATLVILCGSLLADSSDTSVDRTALEADVQNLLRQGNVDVRGDVEKVFRLGDLYLAEKNISKAQYYYTQGLKVDAWNLPYQLKFAKLLKQKNEIGQAVEKARLVYDYAETENLITQSDALLTELNNPSSHPSIPSLAESLITIEVVPMGHVNMLLLQEVLIEAQQVLGINFILSETSIDQMGEYDRTKASQYIHYVIEQMQIEMGQKAFRALTKQCGVIFTDQSSYEDSKKIVFWYIKSQIPQQLNEFKQEISELETTGQYDAERLKRLLKRHVSNSAHIDGYLGITGEGIYANDYNFLFGWASPRWGVMSYHRFTAAFNDDKPNRPILRKRTLKQLISSSFFILGIPRCTNPMCARAYPNSLTEHDRKPVELCNWCKEKLHQKISNKQ